ncbi:hypothetical protein SNEBB_002332 [Seison nebaliae]|nr:hypothetical protein SNEBB_002332 [Seison nebaliae]
MKMRLLILIEIISLSTITLDNLVDCRKTYASLELWGVLKELTGRSRQIFQHTCLCDGVCSCDEIFNSPLIKFKKKYQSLYSRKHLYDAYACFVKRKLGLLPPANAGGSVHGCSGLCCVHHYKKKLLIRLKRASCEIVPGDQKFRSLNSIYPHQRQRRLEPRSLFQPVGGCRRAFKRSITPSSQRLRVSASLKNRQYTLQALWHFLDI